ncbi:MAG: pyruvate dehydrogenase complex dihydrolipoamide acetyltransferase [Clostridiales bacterium]|nr:pyruvate dehydrogenase complex dihydrolipoamide acetyltransferase [Clostridiales bacterium]
MAEQVLMIALSPTMEEGTLVSWQKKEGDWVDSGDVLCEVETDKATMDYESTSEGTLLKIIVEEGGQAAIGEVIAILGEEGEDFSSLLPTGDTNGDSSQQSGDGDSSQILDDEEIIEEKLEEQKPGDSSQESRVKVSPLARKIADMNDLSLNEISGSGPDGRIVKADVEKFIEEETTNKKAEKTKQVEPNPAKQGIKTQGVQVFPGDEEIPVTGKRRIIAQRLAESKYNAPHYYLTITVAADNLVKTRKSLNESQVDKVSFNTFLMKYVAEALKKHPMVNASWNGDTILKRKQADIGLAVAQTDGLITPVVRDCGNKGMLAIDQELRDLIERARNNKLMPEEYQNASFSISNLGSFGIDEFTAVINPPGSAILAVGAMKKVPAVDQDDNIVIETQMKLTLSCDHRIIDGAVGAAFLKELKDIIEDPIRALF